MLITKTNIKKLKEIYLKKYNINLSDQQATEIAHRLVNLFHVIIKHQPYEQNGDIRKKVD